jgi:hypothetical protein
MPYNERKLPKGAWSEPEVGPHAHAALQLFLKKSLFQQELP